MSGVIAAVKNHNQANFSEPKTLDSSRSRMMKGNPANFLSPLTSPPARRRAFFRMFPLFLNVLLRWFLSAFKEKCYSFKMDTFTKATSTRVSRQVPFPCYPVRRNLCSPPTRLPDPATRAVPHRCGGGRSQAVWQSLKVFGKLEQAP